MRKAFLKRLEDKGELPTPRRELCKLVVTKENQKKVKPGRTSRTALPHCLQNAPCVRPKEDQRSSTRSGLQGASASLEKDGRNTWSTFSRLGRNAQPDSGAVRLRKGWIPVNTEREQSYWDKWDKSALRRIIQQQCKITESSRNEERRSCTSPTAPWTRSSSEAGTSAPGRLFKGYSRNGSYCTWEGSDTRPSSS